ncbi:hypothetical protein GCM10007385_24840 [Tateyamaria omphalii]|uniref:hypothetical protein n=1 Tax=Tateyamaria omphalii TaxID=299262 RepID=UPI0016755834|nr:hypothetical protein [Tateyamaria omphalii]GGX55344.1 hypothetical protein GCM10007385_24840 [Tateyamaria omphalii]
MQIVLHAGAHFTEEDRLMRCLLRNKEEFSKRGVAVPGPSKYRPLLKDTLAALQDAQPAPDARDVLMDLILDEENADRMILSHMFLFGAPRACIRDGKIYRGAAERVAQLSALFAHDEFELFLAIRNPATFLPALFDNAPQKDMAAFLRGADPYSIRWSETLSSIRAAAPDVTITTWCFEDMPMLWAQIVRELAGLEHGEKIIGGFDLLSDIMSKEGMQRFRAYLKSHPHMTEMQKRRVIAAFLDKFAIQDEIEEELNAPGWTDETVETLTDMYEEDMERVARIPGVTLIAP